jgi:transposase InsO family protein
VAAEDGPGLQSSNNAPNLAEELATYVAGLHSSEIDAATVERVKSHLVDTLGCGIAAFDEGPVRICPGQDTETGVNALIKNARELPQELCKSLTWDRGKEMAGHKRFTLATDIQVYFCDPRNPWQRGSNENTNGLLRQYLPKGIDISSYSQAKLNAVARQLNERPRKTLGYQTPAEMFSQTVALTS